MFGLGKPRSKFGKFLDKNDITQQDIVRKSGVSRGTVSRLCQGSNCSPTMKNAKKVLRAAQDLSGKQVDYEDFWD